MEYKILGYPCVNILFDERRPEKLEPLLNELQRQGITDYKFWKPVEDVNSVVRSINLSIKQIIQDAKDRGLKEVAIWEDDCMFEAEDGWEYFLKNKPDSFDVYIGGTYFVDQPDRWEPPVVKVNTYVGNHCIIVAEKYYDRFLSVPEDAHVDMAQEGMGDFMVCFPFAAIQRPGFSSNAKADVNYNASLRKQWIYKG